MKPTPAAPGPALVRSLGPVMATAIIIGTVIGSGIFKKPYSIAQNVHEFGLVALVWVLGGVLTLLGALAYAEVSVLLPQAGGNYVFLRESYGRLAGFLWGWVEFLIIKAASLAALATIFAESFKDLLQNHSSSKLTFWEERLLTVAVLLGLAWINARGTRWGGGLQVFITSVKVGTLLFILLAPFVVLAFITSSSSGSLPGSARLLPSIDNLKPIWPDSWRQVKFTGLATAFLGVLWAYHGWQNLTPVAAEVTRPQRNLPLALLLGVGVVILLYLGVNLAYYFVLPGSEMAALEDTTVAAEFSRRLLGPGWGSLASAAIACSVFGALNGLLLITPRLLFAMGEDGLAPRKLHEVHPRYHTPATAIWVMAAWASILVLAVAVLKQTGVVEKPWFEVTNKALASLRKDGVPENVVNKLTGFKEESFTPVAFRDKLHQFVLDDDEQKEYEARILKRTRGAVDSVFDVLTNFAMFGAVIFETLAVLAIFALRRKMPLAPRPYRCLGYPVVPALYVILPGCVLVNMFISQQLEAATGVVFIALGVVTYYLFGLQKTGPAPH